METAEIFVVRVYRRAPKAPGELAGVVDVIAAGSRHAFASLDGLLAILQAHTHAKSALFAVPVKRERKET